MHHTATAKLLGLNLGLATLVTLALGQTTPATPAQSEPIMILEKFILTESVGQGTDTLMQTARPLDSVFLGNPGVMDTPRSVTVLTPEAMKQFAVKGFEDLDRVGAGLTRPNIFGIPGLPFIRGDNAGVYFNGMRRIPNQNETPTSFGSLDAMDLVKGPAPAQFGPTNAGGYANFVPKSPYFDKFRGSIQFTAGSSEYYNTQVDVGGPLLVSNVPLAYRISVTNQQAKSYYRDIKNDYISVYAAAKARLTPKLSLFTGAEYYSFKSNENAGWNRVTQDLIDHGNYIIGDMDPNTTSAALGGYTDVNLIRNQVDIAFSTGFDPNLAIVVPTAVFQAKYGAPTGVNSTYASGAPGAATPIFYHGQLYGYKYTPAYFSAGGQLFTKKITGDQVLSDPSDYANSETFIWFADLVWNAESGRKFSAKSFYELISTRKLSSYGFAHDSDSWAFEEKLVVDESHELGGVALGLQYGGDVRYTFNNDANDFGVEPFNRRDISDPLIKPQAAVLVGPQVGWPAGFVGGSRSTLGQLGLFGQFRAKFNNVFSLLGGGRLEGASFMQRTPREFAVQAPKKTGGKNYYSWSLNPVFRLGSKLTLYGAIQGGTSLQPAQTGGVNSGEKNFVEAPFYEAGAKVNLLDNRLFASASVYKFEKATLANLPIGGVDSDEYTSRGYEFELSYAPTSLVSIIGSFGQQVSKFDTRFPFTTRPFTPEQVALYSGSIQYGPFGQGPGGSRYVNNPEAERAGYPQFNANLFVVINLPGGLGVGAGPSYKEDFWLDNEHTLKLPDALVWNANVFYRTKRYEIFLRLNNVTDEDYFIGASFAPTMIVTKAKPFEANLTLTMKF